MCKKKLGKKNEKKVEKCDFFQVLDVILKIGGLILEKSQKKGLIRSH